MASQGLTDREIAESTHLSPATLKSYWIRLREKVGATNRTGAVVKAMELLSRRSGNLSWTSIDLWWRIMCRNAPWFLLVLDPESVVTFMSRPIVRGASEFMLGRSALELAEAGSQETFKKAMLDVREGKPSVDCCLVLQAAETTVLQFTGKLARIDEFGQFVGAIYFVERTKRVPT
jgi:hypothetical protein